MWIFILAFPHFLVHIFTSDKDIMPLAVSGLRLYFAAFVFQSLQYGGQSVFKSLGMNKKAIFFSLFRKVVLVVPLTMLLPYIVNPSVNGVYLAEPISNIIGGMAAFTTMILTVYIPCRRKVARDKNDKAIEI
jgi:Na+-driven multidrug efflux pump